MIDGELVAEGTPRELLESPPSMIVARFLGFDGQLECDRELVLTRPAHVTLDAAGPLQARVTRAIALEDGARLELELESGRLYAISALPAPRVGDAVRLRVEGGARFPRPTTTFPLGDQRLQATPLARDKAAPNRRGSR